MTKPVLKSLNHAKERKGERRDGEKQKERKYIKRIRKGEEKYTNKTTFIGSQ